MKRTHLAYLLRNQATAAEVYEKLYELENLRLVSMTGDTVYLTALGNLWYDQHIKEAA